MKNYSKLFGIMMIAISLLLAASSCKKDDDDNEDVKPTVKSSEKQIMTFTFAELTPVVAGTITETTKTIQATVPSTTDVTTLVPTIGISSAATINPASGVAQDFTNPVVYTVTAEDGSTSIYTVTVELDGSQAEILSGTMSSNRTLPNVSDGIDYIVNGMLYIDGNALLTVEAGVKIAFTGVDGEIYVNENAGLKFEGTSNDPIILTGPVNNQNRGSWGGVSYCSNRADNIIDYTYFEYGGSDFMPDNSTIAIEGSGSAKIRNSKVSYSEGFGIRVSGTLKELTGCTIEECNDSPVFLEDINDALSGVINSSNSFYNNTNQHIKVYYSTAPESAYNLNDPGIPYYLASGLYVEDDLIIEKGTDLMFGNATELYVYDGGKIVAEAEASKPITFNGLAQEAGYWNGIVFEEATRVSILDRCIIDNAGNSNGWSAAIVALHNLTINNTTIQNSIGYGVIIGDESNITHNNVMFADCAEGNVYNNDTGETFTTLP